MADFSITQTAAYGLQAYTLTLAQLPGQEKTASPDSTSSFPAAEQAGDLVSLSKEGKELSVSQKTPVSPGQNNQKPANTQKAGTTGGNGIQPLNEAELRQIQELQSRDIEVRTHEQAHLSAAGQYAAGGPSYSYQTGPDGKQYAIGGSVPIDLGKESTPEATIIKMRTVKRAALAPANPSGADRQIAAQAGMQELQAIQEEIQAAQATANQKSPSQPANDTKSESTASQETKNTQKEQTPLSNSKEPSVATRTMMNAAYKAMASLA
jgi:hypothetical protein